MKNSITVITRFPVPAGLAPAQMHTAFAAASPNFRNVPNLIRKQFLLSSDGRTAGGVYLWTDEAAARSFMSEQVVPMIRNHFHVEPTMEYFESPLIVENNT